MKHRIVLNAARAITSSIMLIGFLVQPLWAQDIRGHTIEVRYKASGRWGTYPANSLMYVSTAGRVFDYTSGQQGDISSSGEWLAAPHGYKSRFLVRKNRLISESISPSGNSLRTTFTVRGDTCTVSQSGPNAQPVFVDYCRVTGGQKGR